MIRNCQSVFSKEKARIYKCKPYQNENSSFFDSLYNYAGAILRQKRLIFDSFRRYSIISCLFRQCCRHGFQFACGKSLVLQGNSLVQFVLARTLLCIYIGAYFIDRFHQSSSIHQVREIHSPFDTSTFRQKPNQKTQKGGKKCQTRKKCHGVQFSAFLL